MLVPGVEGVATGSTPAPRRGEEDRFGDYDPKTFGRKVVVRGLPYTINKDEALRIFGEYGTVVSLGGMANRMGKQTGWANIVYESEEEAMKAMEGLNGRAFGPRFSEALIEGKTRFPPREKKKFDQMQKSVF